MKDVRFSRRLIKKWHVREKATIDHLVGALSAGTPAGGATVHSAVTTSGLCVEEQVRKAWQPSPVGLAIF